MKQYRYVLLAAVLFGFSALGLKAQDTVNTSYYRYSIHPTYLWMDPPPFSFYDTLTGQYPIDPVTGEYISVCPNGEGFATFIPGVNGDITINGQHYYAAYEFGASETDLYGIALTLRHIANFTVGDSMVTTLFDWPDIANPPIPIDSIVIRGGDIGKRRWMEIPMLDPQNLDEGYYTSLSFRSSIHDDCISEIKYLPLMEFYFDVPRRISHDSLWYMIRVYQEHGSRYNFSSVATVSGYALQNRWENWPYIDQHPFDFCPGHWHVCFPITEPLPDWEVALLDTLIPMPTKPENPDPDPNDPNNPDNPGDPNDPDNPEDPNDPDNPDDPTDPEAINGVYGNLPISVYPNPTNGMTTISSPEAIKELTVTDLAGRMLLHQSSLGTNTTLDTAPLEPGLYLLKVTTASGTATTKLAVR